MCDLSISSSSNFSNKSCKWLFLSSFCYTVSLWFVFWVCITTGQTSIIAQPVLRGFWGDSLTKPQFKATSAEVGIICKDNNPGFIWGFDWARKGSHHPKLPSAVTSFRWSIWLCFSISHRNLTFHRSTPKVNDGSPTIGTHKIEDKTSCKPLMVLDESWPLEGFGTQNVPFLDIFGSAFCESIPIRSLDVTPRDVHSQLMPTHVKEPVKGVRNGSSWQGKYRMKCIEMSECEKLKLKHKHF